MSRRSRLLVASTMLLATAGLVSLSPSVLAQPPGFEKGKGFDKGKDFEKGGKGFERGKGIDRSTEKAPPPAPVDPVKKLEEDLARLKALEADIQSQLKRLKGEPPATPEPAPSTGRGPDRGPAAGGPPGGFGRGFGGPGGFGRGSGGFGPGGAGFGGMARGSNPVAHGIARALSYLSADQLKELIGELEKVRAEKVRAEAPAPRPAERRPGSEGRPAAQNDEIIKRLDRLAQELDEIRKSIKR